MKKIIVLLFVAFLSLWKSFASDIIDNSLITELDKTNTKELNLDFGLKTFKSCENLESVMQNYIKDYWATNKDKYYARPIMMYDDMASESLSEWAISKEASLDSNAKAWWWAPDYSQTNTQVAWVDESDIIKTDWDYTYYYNETKKAVFIAKANPASSMEIIKQINLPENIFSPVLYISNNKLIILASWYSNSNYYANYWINRNSKTYSIIFDVSDKKSPKLEKLYISEWNFVESRKIWKYLYVISNNSFNIPYYGFKAETDIKVSANNILPKKLELSRTSDTTKQNLKLKWQNFPYTIESWNVAKCNEIEYSLPDKATLEKFEFSPSYNIISVIDTENSLEKVKTKVVAWNNSSLYMSLENLYLTDSIYQTYNFSCPANAKCLMPYYYGWSNNTLVHKLNVSWNSLKYQTSTIIPWNPLNQYSMDENNSNFRIVTSEYFPKSSTSLYILDKDLNLTSSLKNLWEWENFQSSRFIWDKLFLVTFQQIDPLFVIDLKDTKNPKILWELKIPGYSTYLHPYDSNHLIWLGYDTKTNEWWWTVNNWIKVDLYEINYDKKCGVSNLTEEEKKKCDSGEYKWIIVKQKYSKAFWENWSYSEALNNPRMFMWNTNKKLLFLPATLYKNDEKNTYIHKDFFQWILAVSINNDSWISEKYRLSHIDYKKAEEDRIKECKTYSTNVTSEPVCKKLLDWSTYCPPISETYVPEYCYADSTVWLYISSKYWDYSEYFVKRALWIWENFYSISDKNIQANSMLNWEKTWSIEMK